MANYTAKDITVLEGLEPVRKRPGMYIGGVGTHRPAPPRLGDARQLHRRGDERLRLEHRASRCTRTASRSPSTDDGRGIPVDKHPTTKKSALEVIFTVLHAGGKFEHGQLQDRRRPARRRRQRRQRAVEASSCATVKRDGVAVGDDVQAGASRPARSRRSAPARGSGHDGVLPSRPDDLPEDRVRSGGHPRAARGRQLPPQGRQGHLRGRDRRRRRTSSSTTKGSPTTSKKIVARARRQAGARSAVRAREARTASRLELVLQWTESTDEHLRSYVNGIPTGSGGTHENGLRAGIGKAVRNYIETHNLSPKGVTLDRRRHPRGADRRAQPVHRRSRSSRGRPRIG